MELNGYLVKSTIVAALGGLLFGFDTAVIAGTTHDLTVAYRLTPGLLGFTVASALYGTIIGAMLAGLPGDGYGRRDSLRILARPLPGIGSRMRLRLELGCARRFPVHWRPRHRRLVGARTDDIAEIAPAKWRGRLVGFFQFNIVFGILLAYFSNFVIGANAVRAAEWRWELGVSAIPAALFFRMLFGIPRSPRWLVKKQRVAKHETF